MIEKLRKLVQNITVKILATTIAALHSAVFMRTKNQTTHRNVATKLLSSICDHFKCSCDCIQHAFLKSHLAAWWGTLNDRSRKNTFPTFCFLRVELPKVQTRLELRRYSNCHRQNHKYAWATSCSYQLLCQTCTQTLKS